MDQVIGDFHEIDREGFGFRYPVDLDKQEYLQLLQALNVRHLAQTIKDIAPLLDGSADGIEDVHHSRIQEREEEARHGQDHGEDS